MGSRALTTVHSVALIAIVLIAAIGGVVAYALWRARQPPPEDIRIGICADLEMPAGKATWQGATLAVEQINAEGGILGRNVTLISEDDDSSTAPGDVAVALNALTKLITVDKADYVIANSIIPTYQDICSEHKKILITLYSTSDNLTQRVVEDYDKYKYYFRTSPANTSTISAGVLGDVLTVVNYTGFQRIALLFQTRSGPNAYLGLDASLPASGLDVVYKGLIPAEPPDFASYLAAVEATGAEILVPYVASKAATVGLIKEWYDRQSPCAIWGVLPMAGDRDFWSLTEGKCDTVSFNGGPDIAGYPLTNKTMPTRDAYIQRWGDDPGVTSIYAYDALRFILSDAIKRAGTTETEAVIKALEATNIETSLARHFVFTSSHDVMVGSGSINDPAEDYMVMCIFQWQNGTQVIMKPETLMNEAGATYRYPSWHGPWDNKQSP